VFLITWDFIFLLRGIHSYSFAAHGPLFAGPDTVDTLGLLLAVGLGEG
jgi:hypothetical protein